MDGLEGIAERNRRACIAAYEAAAVALAKDIAARKLDLLQIVTRADAIAAGLEKHARK